MPRGGYRPGAGRPKGSKNKPKVKRAAAQPAAAEAVPADDAIAPLEYMLNVMRDPAADQSRRDRMAIAAAPLVHAKPTEPGKKARKTDAAQKLLESGRFAPSQAPLGLGPPAKLN